MIIQKSIFKTDWYSCSWSSCTQVYISYYIAYVHIGNGMKLKAGCRDDPLDVNRLEIGHIGHTGLM